MYKWHIITNVLILTKILTKKSNFAICLSDTEKATQHHNCRIICKILVTASICDITKKI